MRTVKFIISVSIIGLTLSGCTTHRIETATKKTYSLEYSPALSSVVSLRNSVTVRNVKVYQDGNEFVVSGQVKRMHKVQLPGHVDLAVCGPDGTLLVQETTRILNLESKRRGVLELPFRFRLDMVPPEGAKIRLEYHAPASGRTELSCVSCWALFSLG